MTGFLLPVLLPAWVAFCAWASYRVGELFTDNPLRAELKALIFVALLPLLVMDELLGKAQFDRLCAETALMTLHAPRLADRRAEVTETPAQPVVGLLLPVQAGKRLYVDRATGETLVSLGFLQASGGKLSRALQGKAAAPLTFSGECEPRQWQGLFQVLGIRMTSAAHVGHLSPLGHPLARGGR
jgi:hypothetical protein